jgi:MFS family permease
VGTGPFQRKILTAAGLCFAADSMEVLLLSFLAVVVQSEWNLTSGQASAITASVFLGAMTGTLLLGPLGDKVGRKPVFILSAAIIAAFGLLTAAANNLASLIIIRFLVGMGVGGLVIPFDSVAEFVPTVRMKKKKLIERRSCWFSFFDLFFHFLFKIEPHVKKFNLPVHKRQAVVVFRILLDFGDSFGSYLSIH